MASPTKELQIAQTKLMQELKAQYITDPETGELVGEPRLRTRYTYTPIAGMVNNQPSETIPDQVESISDLLQRMQKGEQVPYRDLQYNEEGDEEVMPLFTDLTDIDEMKSSLEIIEGRIEEAKRKAEQEKDNVSSPPPQKEKGGKKGDLSEGESYENSTEE